MPDPRYAHCPACAGGRVDCGECGGEGIVEEAWRVTRTAYDDDAAANFAAWINDGGR